MAGIYQPITAIDDSDSTIKGDAMLVAISMAAAQITYGSPEYNAMLDSLQASAMPYIYCVRDNSRTWAETTNEAVGDVVEGAIGSCLEKYKALRLDFIAAASRRLHMTPLAAAQAFDEIAAEFHDGVKRVGLTAALNARAHR